MIRMGWLQGLYFTPSLLLWQIREALLGTPHFVLSVSDKNCFEILAYHVFFEQGMRAKYASKWEAHRLKGSSALMAWCNPGATCTLNRLACGPTGLTSADRRPPMCQELCKGLGYSRDQACSLCVKVRDWHIPSQDGWLTLWTGREVLGVRDLARSGEPKPLEENFCWHVEDKQTSAPRGGGHKRGPRSSVSTEEPMKRHQGGKSMVQWGTWRHRGRRRASEGVASQLQAGMDQTRFSEFWEPWKVFTEGSCF